MAAMDHEMVGDGERPWCGYCCEDWPCQVAQVRHELAELLRRAPVAAHETDGVGKAAELIDIW